MDARAYYLSLHEHAHGSGRTGIAKRVLGEPTPAQWRAILPGHNSITWCVWHIARGEDWAVRTMLQGQEQLLTRDGWDARLGVGRRDFGAGMTADEVAELSARIDLEALRAYYHAVVGETRRFAETLDFDALDQPLDVPARVALAPDAIAPAGSAVRALVERQTTQRWFLSVMTLADVYLLFAEADHTFRLPLPERRFP
jgi:hypothetical protein